MILISPKVQIMKRVFLIVASSFLIIQCTTEPGNGVLSKIISKVNQEATECEKLDILDAEMQQLVKEIKTKYRAEQFFNKRFEMSQVYWIQYRDRHLRALYPLDWNTYYRKEYSAETFNECKCEELNRMTINRIRELVMYLGESEKKGKCPSIWNQ